MGYLGSRFIKILLGDLCLTHEELCEALLYTKMIPPRLSIFEHSNASEVPHVRYAVFAFALPAREGREVAKT